MKKTHINSLLLVIFLLSLCPLTSYAQWVPKELQTSPTLKESDNDKFSVDAEVLGFFKNNEYFSPISKGETFPGIRFIPRMGYQVGGKAGMLRAEIGAQGQYYSGDQEKKGFKPFKRIFARMQYSILPTLHFTLGNYHGGVNHRLIEPLYRWERHYSERPESGLQLMYEDKKYFGDIWLDWKRYVEHGDSVPEVLTFGFSGSVKLSDPESKWQFSIPAQLTIHHSGGQINDYDERMIVVGNLATGICSEVKMNRGFLKSLGFDLYAVGYYDKRPEKEVRPYKQGWGVYPVVKMNANHFNAMMGYWYAQNFFSYIGEPLFGSFNPEYPGEKLQKRSVLTFKASYSRHLFDIFSIGGQAETYTDLKKGKTEYSFGVHLRADFRIFTK